MSSSNDNDQSQSASLSPSIPSETLLSSSQLSIGFPERSNSNLSKVTFVNLPGPLASDKNVAVTDECCVGIYCTRHDKMLLTIIKNKGLFLPNFTVRSSDSWFEVATVSIEYLLQLQRLPVSCQTSPLQIVNFARFQLPKQYPHYLTRVTIVVTIDHDPTKANSVEEANCQSKKDDPYKWFSYDETRQNETLWGIEPLEIFRILKEYSKKMSTSPAESVQLPITMIEYNIQDAIQFLTSSNPSYQKEKELLLSARFTIEEISKLYNEFVIQCYPSQFMTYISFRAYMNKIGWVSEEEMLIRILFRSYVSSVEEQARTPNYLTFNELIVGLSAMEERADHRANCLQLRLRYIFHFYDCDADGKLNVVEINQMMCDVVSKRRTNSASEIRSSNECVRKDTSLTSQNPCSRLTTDIENVVAEMLRRIANQPVNDNSAITYSQFMNCLESEQNCFWLAEMSEQLFRSNISTIDVCSQKFDYKLYAEKAHVLKAQTASNRYEVWCEKCHFVHFHMCSHGVKIDEHGLLRGTIKFDVSPSYKDTPFVQELNISESNFILVNTVLHKVSLLAINASNPQPEKGDKSSKDKELISNFRQILELTKAIVRKEPVLMQCISPCYVIGEVRSNLTNLHGLISTILRMAPFVNPVNIVFLGNYIDPNASLSVETVIYLFCFKVLMPQRITLLRGSTEFRSAVVKSKFHKECVEMYDHDVWNDIYEIFDMLPFAMVVDEKLFLTRSGIPMSTLTLDKIEEFKIGVTPKLPILSANETYLLNCIINGKPTKNQPENGGGGGGGVATGNSSSSSSSNSSSSSSANSSNNSSNNNSTANNNNGSRKSHHHRGSKSCSSSGSSKKHRTNNTKKSPKNNKASNNNNSKNSNNKKSPRATTTTKGKGGKPSQGRSSHSAHSKATGTTRSKRNNNKRGKQQASSNSSNNANSGGSSSSQNTAALKSSSQSFKTALKTSQSHTYLDPLHQLGFTNRHLQQFLKQNQFSYLIRTDSFPISSNQKSFKQAMQGKMITLGGIGQASAENGGAKATKTNGTILLIARNKLRLIRVESYERSSKFPE